MNIHTKFIVHWTGKDFGNKPDDERPQLYLERMMDYYQNGLFIKRTEEASIRFVKLKNIVRLCFTEIRLSQAEDHANKYGKFGIGFSRDFILERGGRPVIYIPFEPHDGLLEVSLTQAFKLSETLENEEIYYYLKYVLCFVKRMENEYGEKYFDELEWRVVYNEGQNNKFITKGEGAGVYRFPFGPSDVKVIIFPDEMTRKLAINDMIIKGYFLEHTPITLTLDDCKNF